MSSARVTILTGASRGIGVAIARELARDGGVLVLTARDLAGLELTAEAVRAAGAKAHVVVGDVTLPEDRERLLQEARSLGDIEVLVNNAGLEIAIALVDQTPDDIQRQLAVNLTAPILLAREVLPEMVSRGRGAVVMISSMSGKSPTPWNSIYTATKFGLNGFTASTRIELHGTGVNIGVVCPSFVAGAGMWADTGVKAPRMMREVPLERVAQGVRAVINGAGEVLVTPSPVRPLLAIAQLLPGMDRPVLERMGVLRVLRERAQTIQRRRLEGKH